jgi:hypothetical protein
MADLTKEQRRINRKLVLIALKEETGSSGGDVAAHRFNAYVADPINANIEDFTYLGALKLSRFYIDPEKPNGAERASLWIKLNEKFGKDAADPSGWDGNSEVGELQDIIEEA